MRPRQSVVVGLSGRGDKDVHTVEQALGNANGHPAEPAPIRSNGHAANQSPGDGKSEAHDR
jgi:hypothetical protein